MSKILYSDLMIDLETTGNTSKAGVLSIGACFFDVPTLTLGPTFYAVLDINDQIKKGRILDKDTMKWWEGQSEEAKQVFKAKKFPVDKVLDAFSLWIKTNGGSKIAPWGNGSSFDISIMETLYTDYGKKPPWMYWNVQDLRTFRRFVANGAKIVAREGVYHNAKDDAVTQAQFVLNFLKEKK